MKWYFSVNAETLAADADHDFPNLIRCAVASAKANTTLRPHLLFDGAECEFTREMRREGVKIIFRKVSFMEQLIQAQRRLRPDWTNWIRTAAGAFLRLEIPLIEEEDAFVLYTDCDIIFLSDPKLDLFQPATFAAASQFDLYGHELNQNRPVAELNSGVMVMNIARLKRDLPMIIDLGCDMLHRLHGYDQEFLRIFYHGRWDPLSPVQNWKPYWGVDPMARILHFHGPKPASIEKLLRDPDYRSKDDVFASWRQLFLRNPSAYRVYFDKWKSYLKLDVTGQIDFPNLQSLETTRSIRSIIGKDAVRAAETVSR